MKCPRANRFFRPLLGSEAVDGIGVCGTENAAGHGQGCKDQGDQARGNKNPGADRSLVGVIIQNFSDYQVRERPADQGGEGDEEEKFF